MKKAPDPQAYWQAQAAKLLLENPELFQQVRAFEFKRWEGESIAYNRQLGARLIKALGNEYDYAPGTFVTGIRTAIHKRERQVRESYRRH